MKFFVAFSVALIITFIVYSINIYFSTTESVSMNVKDVKDECQIERSEEPKTLILGEGQVTANEAQSWAQSNNAHQRFIDICPIYWTYGKLTGIRPDLLYCQAAHETNFGHYGRHVTPDQNNWSGIKKIDGITGPGSHENFDTPEDGVRAHFNHMCAYTDRQPIGKPHDRYQIVLKKGYKIKYVEELGGKWAISQDYGIGLVNLLNKLITFKR